jgi:hypothetical protein
MRSGTPKIPLVKLITKIPRLLKYPKGSLQYSQGLTTGLWDRWIHPTNWHSKIHFNIILLCLVFHVSFPTESLHEFLIIQSVLYAPFIALFYDRNNISWRIQIVTFFDMKFSSVCSYILPLMSTYSFQDILHLCSFPHVRDQISHQYRTIIRINNPDILIVNKIMLASEKWLVWRK